MQTADAYRDFLAARRALLAGAMTDLLERFRPGWLDARPSEQPEPLAGSMLEFVLYESGSDAGHLIVRARHQGTDWMASVRFPDLEAALRSAYEGLDSDLDLGRESLPVRVTNDVIEIPLGPFLVTGTAEGWRKILQQERNDARPLRECPEITATSWESERAVFPVTDVD